MHYDAPALTLIYKIQGVLQNSLRFLFCYFSAHNTPKILFFDLFQQSLIYRCELEHYECS